jgi:L-lactate utilization protein LutC
MFLASSAKPIDDSLQNIVAEIETQNPNLSVVVARQLRYSLQQTTVELTITEPRPFNVLEEFIIRAGIEFEPPPTANELASLLGLDAVFVESTIKNLQKLQTLAQKSPITVTEQGRLFYDKGAVPQPPYAVQIHAITDSLGETLTFQAEPLNEVVINLPSLASVLNINEKINEISAFSLEQIQNSLQASGVELHLPEVGKIVTAFRVIPPSKTIWRKISLFLIFDAKADKLIIQLRRGKQILDSRSKWLEILLSEGKISLDTVCKLPNQSLNFEREATLKYQNSETAARLKTLRQQALESNNKQVIQIRDRLINQTFLEIINTAKQQIIIYSHSLQHLNINPEFITLLKTLAKRGVWILIGYGIEAEISLETKEKLQAMKTPEDLPCVHFFCLEDSPIKEIIVDRQTYICGSYQWLDYNGYQIPLGESVYQVTIPQQVQEAYRFLSNHCQNHAQQLWQQALENLAPQLAVESLCIWGALGKEEIAFTEIEKNNWLELLPTFINVVIHGLRLNNLADDSAILKSALSLLSQVEEEAAFIEPLQQAYRQLIGAIAKNNPGTALNLLNNQVWAQFLRLKIASESDSPDEFISQQTSPAKTKLKSPETEKKKKKAKA